MDVRLCFMIVIFGTIILSICNGTELNSNEKEAWQFAHDISEKSFKFFEKLRDDEFNDAENFNQSQAFFDEAMFLKDIVSQAKQFDFKNFKDKELKYAFGEIVKFADLKIIGGEQFVEIFASMIDLAEIELYKNYDCFKGCDGSNSKDISASQVKEILETSKNSEELQFYWKQMREALAGWAEKNFNVLLNGLKNAAKLSDMSDLEFWLREYNLTELENLMNGIQPFYKELHAFIRNGLQKKYGDSIVKSDGLIPHHLFEQVMAQAWKNGSIIEEMFPFENLPPVESVLQKRFKSKELYEIADRFYQKLGFSEFPQQVWKDHIKMKKSEIDDSYDCSSDLYYSSPNIHLEFCEKMNFENFLNAYSEMGILHYAKEMTGLPAYYFHTHDWNYSIGKAAILSASTFHNLKAIGMILEFNFTDEVEMNRLLRKSIHSLLEAAVDFVHTKLMADLLSGNVERKELNTKYWELMDKYVGVEPPKNYETKPDVLDMPFTFYNDMSFNDQSRKFESEIMGYQMYKKFCELSGKYPMEPLHLCDIHGSKAVGDLLKNMMRLGASKPYNEVLATMFPESQEIRAESMLEYYSPVKKFLMGMNSKANVKPGWKHSH